MQFIPEYIGTCDVDNLFKSYFKLLTNKCMSIFKFKNLPSTVDERFLQEQLILNGKVFWFADQGNIYALNGTVGGEPNVYYEPSFAIIANPILGSKTLRIRQKDGSDKIDGLEAILMSLTDVDNQLDWTHGGGLYHLIYKTAGLLADNISSLNCAQINGRAAVAFTADNQAIANTAEEVLKDIYAGKPYKVLTQDILNKITATPLASTGQNNTIMTLIEASQYILSQFYSEIGIISNFNMKRERINTAESEMNTGCLDINIWNMKKNLEEGVERVNELFGTSIEVELNEEIFFSGSGNATFGEDPVSIESEGDEAPQSTAGIDEEGTVKKEEEKPQEVVEVKEVEKKVEKKKESEVSE